MKLEFKQLCKIAVVIFLLYLAIHFWPGVLSFVGTLFAAAAPLLIGCVIAYVLNLLMGCVIAYVLNLLMGWYEKHWFPCSKKPVIIKTRRAVCLTAAILSLLLIISLIIGLILPELTACFMLIVNKFPSAIGICLDYIEQWGILPEDIIGLLESIDWQSRIGEFLEAFTNGLGGVMGTVIKTVTSVFSGIVTALIAIIFSLYLLLGKDKLKAQCSRLMRHYCKPVWHDRIYYVLQILDECFRKYIVGQCTEAVILGLLCTVGMLILGFPYATMIGALVAFTALIPIAGAYIGAGVGAFMILTVSPVKALLFLVFIVVLQQLEGNIIYPRVVGSSLGLPGIWVLAAVTVGGGIMGITGMLLGVPMTAALYRILQEDLHAREVLAGEREEAAVTEETEPAPESAETEETDHSADES